MPGVGPDAEDIVHDTDEKWLTHDTTDVHHP